jgi:hypothetical protein
MYIIVSNSTAHSRKRLSLDFVKPSRFSDAEKAFSSLLNNDLWKLKFILTNLLNKPGQVDLSLTTPVKEARCFPICFKAAFKALTPDMRVEEVEEKKGAITFFPIRHCRWCGLVKQELQMCRECAKKGVGYMDKNWFCSDDCENTAWERVHEEEHTRFLMICNGSEPDD